MTHADWLQTLAEIGLGFAGFSALLGILGIAATNFTGFVFSFDE